MNNQQDKSTLKKMDEEKKVGTTRIETLSLDEMKADLAALSAACFKVGSDARQIVDELSRVGKAMEVSFYV